MSSKSVSDFPSEEASTTARKQPKGAVVLVVHDSTADGMGVWDVLHQEFIVRDVTTAFDTLEWLSGTNMACIVCVLGVTFGGEDFYNLVARLSQDQARRIVFIAASDNPDIAFLKRAGCNWLPLPVTPDELIALVRAVSTR